MTIELSTLVRIGQGRAAEVFALDRARVVKVARATADDSLEREAAALRAAKQAGMSVPAVHELTEIDGRRALVMDRAPGVDMLRRFGARPWTLLRAGSKLGRLHAKLHATVAPDVLPTVKAEIARRIETSPHVPPDVLARVTQILAGLPDGDRLCHLDYHPGNVLTDGATLTVIDWPAACRGDPLADVAATVLALRGGTPTPGTPLLTRLFAPLGRKVLLGGYSRGYQRARPIDRALLHRWQVVMACLRLTYGIGGEREPLLATIDRRAHNNDAIR